MGQTNEFKLLVCGSRDLRNKEFVFKKLDELLKNKTDYNIIIIQGGQKSFDKKLEYEYGADYFAKLYAQERGYQCIEEKADWDQFKKAAGVIRNSKMLSEHKPDACAGFFVKTSTNRGTTDMVNKCIGAGLPTRQIIYGL